MGFLSSFTPKRQVRNAAFPGASVGRLTATWTTDPGAINRWLRYELSVLRARSRQLARGDAYGARFISACVNNIAGPQPFILQSKAKTSRGGFNVPANQNIELAWKERSRPGNWDVTGRLSRNAFIRLMIRCLARDGEVLVRRIRGAGLRLQLLDIDRLDEGHNQSTGNGRTIKMGVELDGFSKPVAYHILKQHPGETGEWNRNYTKEYERVPADQIAHLFVADWPEQVRGFPWMHAAMVRLHHLGGFEEAAVINARVGASKVAVIQGPQSDFVAEANASGTDAQGNLLTDVEPGQYWRLPDGTTLGSFNPQFPDASVDPFIKACLRGVAAAVGMSYHSLANDPGEVNYSTARVALMDERDGWSTIQSWFVEHFCEPDAADWLSLSTLSGDLPVQYLPYRNSLYFQPRTWDWIDPEKDVNAEVTAKQNKIKSLTQIIRERGGDIEDTFDEIAAEQELAKQKGIELEPPKPKPAEPKPEPKPEEKFVIHNHLPDHKAGDVNVKVEPAQVNIQPPVVNAGDVTVNTPETKSDTHIHMAETQAPDVTVNMAPTEVKLGDSHTHIQVPEQKAPDVNVTVEPTVVNLPEQRAPEVNVKVEPAQITNNVDVAPPQVTVHQVKSEDTEEVIERDGEREITRITRRTIKEE